MSISKYLRILSCTKFGSSSTFVNLWGKGSHGWSETKMSITHDRQRQERWACLYLHRWRGLVGEFVEDITCCNDLCETIRCLNSQHLTLKDLRIFVACLWFLHTKHRTLNFEYRKPVVWKGTWNGCIPKKVGWKTGPPKKKLEKFARHFTFSTFGPQRTTTFLGSTQNPFSKGMFGELLGTLIFWQWKWWHLKDISSICQICGFWMPLAGFRFGASRLWRKSGLLICLFH